MSAKTDVYTITVGNRIERKGHRADCAQVTVEFDVCAYSIKEAVQIVKDADTGKPVSDPAWLHSDADPYIGLLRMRVYLNGATISERTVGLGG